MLKIEASKLLEKGFAIIPLLKNKKNNHDAEILTRDYKLDDLYQGGNLGINLQKSRTIDIDLDSHWSIYFGKIWLPINTRILGRRYPNGREELTHYFFKNMDGVSENITRKNLAGETIAEFRVKGNTVVFGTTAHKDTKEPMLRFWKNEITLSSIDAKPVFNKICFASALAPHVKSANTGALKLDACLMRYTSWSEGEREDFLYDIYKKVLPNDREISRAKFKRIIKANNKKTKNAGYKSFADYINVDGSAVKEWFGWIGKITSEDKYEKVKSICDFTTTSFDMANSLKKEFPPMKYAVESVLPEGLVCIAGRPKAMKSWTVLDLCYKVQNGLPWLQHRTVQGDCLYLALEDSERRIVDRVKKLRHHQLKQNPLITDKAPYLGLGLEESIEDWMEEVSAPRLVAIDTLARIKPKAKKVNATAFDLDNELLRDIQKLAISKGITIVFVTHLGKAQQDYSFDRIQGSVGMQGIADAMWLIDRGDNSPTASITGRGRDIRDFEYSVKWNEQTWRYDYVGVLSEVSKNENRSEVLEAMKALHEAGDKELRPRDVINHIGYSHNSKDAKRITKTMQRMRDGFELKPGSKYGTYVYDESEKIPF